ncbi:proenkephalin a [Sardina pilchardus]|uniref:proenkephalin a n=1 Tax=Sardina pilchardus TaxID=27697 RepID=UPI002E110C0F
MAVTVNFFRILAVCSCLALAVGICRKDCALCMYRREGTTKASSLSCTLECEGGVDNQNLDMCRDVLTEEERTAALQLQGSEGEAERQHQLTKKYGGFMKRYGGLVMKKTAEIGDDTGAHFDGEDTELMSKRYGGFMKKDATAHQEGGEARQLQALREILNLGVRDAQNSDEASKHFDDFMRDPQESNKDMGRDLQKRYGGFMRRVGRPEWLVANKVHGGFAKRFLEETAETSIPNMEKRYGGFMD